ncbi:Hypothetical predicted protein [Podarcis lilfordi]|uniref:Uncharacterized protein n=1 Tax=Podarcis lilfordi TaxID=74358 RepID=A0AA35JUL3_9SAUR|nr:Hypothetical predicted protein [Podarcis lilfordi]
MTVLLLQYDGTLLWLRIFIKMAVAGLNINFSVFFPPLQTVRKIFCLQQMSKNDDDQQFTIDNAIKNMDKMSSELNKLMVKTQLLLCDLILNFSHPALTDVSTEADEKKREESTNL